MKATLGGRPGHLTWRDLAAAAASFLVHAGLAGLLVVVTTREVVDDQPSTEDMVTVAVVDVAPEPADVQPDRKDEAGVAEPALAIDGFNFDLDKIGRRRYLLFPLIRDDVAVDALVRAAEDHARRPLTNPFARAGARQGVAFSLSARDVQGVVDRAWSRSERWDAFAEIAALTGRHDANDDTLALVLRKYVDENLLQPFYDVSTPDPRLWVVLRIAADFVDFLDFVAAYVRTSPGTKTATELLFLLDELIQANQDALATLLRTPEADLQFTRTANPEAFELVSTIRNHYQQALGTAGLSSADDVARRYDSVRLMVLSTIVNTTPDGYRIDDARFLAGEIHWRAEQHDEAIRLWRQMRPDPQDAYYLAEARVQDAIAAAPPNTLRVRQALRDQQGRWWVASVDRLRQFGYRPDRY